MNNTVSIITSTYNLEQYIGACIESVQNQTYIHWEMIIVDDCSTDKTVEIARHYAKKDQRITVLVHKKNWSVYKLKDTYNQALKQAKGDFIAVLEGDDFWPKDKLEIQMHSFQDDEVILSYGDSVFTNGEGRPFDILYYRRDSNLLNNDPTGSILHLFTDLNFYLSPVTVVIRKNALNTIGGFQNAPHYYFVDFPTWLHLSQQGKFHYVKKVMGFYRRHPGSFWLQFAGNTSSMTRNEMQDTLVHFIKTNKKLLQKNNISVNIKKMITEQNTCIEKKRKRRGLSFLMHNFAYGDKKDIFKSIRQMLKSEPSFLNRNMSRIVFLLIPFRSTVIYFIFIVKKIKYTYFNI